MSIHHLCESSGGWTGPALTRTEVKALPYPSLNMICRNARMFSSLTECGPPAPTYKEVAIRFQSEAEQRYEEYERSTELCICMLLVFDFI